MTPEQTKLFAHQLVQAWNAHDLERILVFYALDYEESDVTRIAPLRGHEALRQAFQRSFDAFPDAYIEVDELIVESDHISVGWTARGTHLGRFMKIPPTGRTVATCGVSIFVIHKEKVFRGRHIWDLAGLLRNVGLLPDL